MDTAMFYDDCAYLPEWPGPPIGDEEGRIIHEALERTSPVYLTMSALPCGFNWSLQHCP
jgi:L-fuculose-phosphate aldolase